jgi:N-methylhydantoinase A
LQPEHFLGGRMRIDPLAAEGALARLADAMGADDLDEVAASVIRVANANMERAIRVISVERGYDPRDFTLLAFGGAGPIHACDLAEALAIPRVVVPAHPGVLSAYGMVVADVTRDYVAPVLRRLDTTGIAEDVLTRFKEMERSGREELATAERGLAGSIVERSLDMRYAGQSYEVEVAADGHDANLWAAAFHAAHEQRYGHGHPGRPVEIVNARVRLRIPRQSVPPQFPLALGAGVRKLGGARPASGAASMPEPVGEVRAWFGRRRATPVYARESLPRGWHVLGPAIVVQMDATTVVKPGWRLSVDAQGNLVLEAH